jgi:dihydrodipicolinate synthase/N-acetylneuraminate lyase
LKASEFVGVIPPLLSSFTKDGEIYEKGVREVVKFTLPFVHGYYPLGTYGAGPLMTTDERQRVLEIILDEVGGRIPVVPHVGHAGTRPSVDLARHAKRAGAAGVGAIGPYYSPKLPDENLYRHFVAIIDAVNEPDFPVFVYNNAHYCQNTISPKLLTRMAEHGLRGCKDSSFDVVNFFLYREAVSAYPDFNVIAGSEALFMACFDGGATGMICGLGNVFPEVIRKMYDAYYAGDRTEAMRIQKFLLNVRELTRSAPTVPILHEILKLRGVDAGYARSPLLELDDTTKQRIRTGLKALNLL